MEDSQILKLYRKRSEEALSETQNKYGAYCRSIAERITGSEEDAREIENEAYFMCWKTIPPAAPASLKTYLGTAVRRLSIDCVKKSTAQKRSAETVPILEELEECLPASESPGDDTLDKALNEFLGTLSVTDRRLFLRRYWYSDPVSAIAREYGMSEQKVSVHLFRTREKLKRFLEKELHL